RRVVRRHAHPHQPGLGKRWRLHRTPRSTGRQRGTGMSGSRLQRILRKHPYLLTLLLTLLALGVNRFLQDNLFEPRVLNGNFRTLLPLMILAVGQTIVVISVGIDLSVGAMVSMVTAVLVTRLAPDSPPETFLMVVALGCLAGMAAGVLNGFAVSILRLQPIVT